jgi:hypothetical protein
MDDYETLRAAHDRARAESCEILERLERLNVTVEERDDYDDPLLSWRRGMPQPEPERHERRANREKLTDSEAQRWWQNYIDGKITAANAQRDKLWREVLAGLVAEVRKQMRAEIAGAVGSLRQDIEIAKANAEKHSAKIENLDLRLMALIGELTKRRIESADADGDVVFPKFLERRRNG